MHTADESVMSPAIMEKSLEVSQQNKNKTAVRTIQIQQSWVYVCGSLNENDPHRLIYLNIWFPTGELLEKFRHGRAGGGVSLGTNRL